MKALLQAGAVEAKNRLNELLKLVENGQDMNTTRHGKPVAGLAYGLEVL